MIAPSNAVHRARDTHILETAIRAGALLRRVGASEWAGPCPNCGGHDRFSLNERKSVFNCRGFGGGDVIDMTRHALGLGFNDAVVFITGPDACERVRRDPPVQKPSATGGETTTADALALWRGSIHPRGTPTERYLAGRHLKLGDDVAGQVLRWNRRIGAMVALFRNIRTGEPQAVSRTYLGADARKRDRRFLGTVGGAAILLDPFDSVGAGLHVCEGLETGVAARLLGLRPCWALGSTGAVAAFPVLDGVECLTILAEHDDASARAVEACAARWHAAGREVLINRPIAGKDLNDAIRPDTV